MSFPPRACGPFSGTWWHPGIDNQTVAPNRWKGRATRVQANTTKALRLKNRNSKEVLTPELIYLSSAIILNRNKSLCLLLFLLLSMIYRHPLIFHAYNLTSLKYTGYGNILIPFLLQIWLWPNVYILSCCHWSISTWEACARPNSAVGWAKIQRQFWNEEDYLKAKGGRAGQHPPMFWVESLSISKLAV